MAAEIAYSGVSKKIDSTRKEFKDVELVWVSSKNYMVESLNYPQKYQGLKTLLDRDNALIQNMRNLVAKEMKTADFATRFIDSYQTHRQPTMTFNNTDPFQYFVNFTDSLEHRLQVYRQTIDDLERHLHSLAHKQTYSPQAIAEILKHQHESFLAVAGKVAIAHDAVVKQREAYSSFRAKYLGDAAAASGRDMFGRRDEGYGSHSRVSLSKIAQELQPSDEVTRASTTGTAGGGGLFGAGGGSSMFGATSGTTTGSNLFGATSSGTGGFGGGGLFGASAAPATASTAPTTSGGLFGQSQAAPSGAASTAFGGFGQPTAAAPAAASTFGGFGGGTTSAFGGFGQPLTGSGGGLFNLGTPPVTSKKKR
ncbi:Nucleoporin p58/p45 [Entophlyctis luteolus]|nr:Nucleoporin p58/p45 [Entophlyctis luteolus]